MHCPDLVNIFRLIKYYSKYDSEAAIAKRLVIDRSNIRNYLHDHANAPYIPVGRHEGFQALFSEILPEPISLERTKVLLSGDADTFHSYISPVAGRAWARLIGLSSEAPRLVIRKRPPLNLGFGTSSHILNQPAECEIKVGDQFILEAQLPLNGQAVVFAENAGVWHILTPNAENAVFPISGRTVIFPPKLDTEHSYLKEGGPAGFYRYFLVGVRGKFSDTLRDHLSAANPLTQPKLDLLGDLMTSVDTHCIVMGATLSVVEPK